MAAILCMTVGRLSRVGLQKSGPLVPVMLSWALIDPPAWDGATPVNRLATGYPLWMALIFIILLVISVFASLSGLAWVYYSLMVPATACLNLATLTQVGELDQRVVDDVVGGILVIIATALAIGYSQWASARGEVSDDDDEVASVATTA